MNSFKATQMIISDNNMQQYRNRIPEREKRQQKEDEDDERENVERRGEGKKLFMGKKGNHGGNYEQRTFDSIRAVISGSTGKARQWFPKPKLPVNSDS